MFASTTFALGLRARPALLLVKGSAAGGAGFGGASIGVLGFETDPKLILSFGVLPEGVAGAGELIDGLVAPPVLSLNLSVGFDMFAPDSCESTIQDWWFSGDHSSVLRTRRLIFVVVRCKSALYVIVEFVM